MAILDSSIVNIAIPKMMSVFGVSLDQINWILTCYMLTLGSIIPLTAYLGDVFGTKEVYMFSLAVFTIGSFLCGFAWNLSSMIVARVIQGLGGGMIMPLGMLIKSKKSGKTVDDSVKDKAVLKGEMEGETATD